MDIHCKNCFKVVWDENYNPMWMSTECKFCGNEINLAKPDSYIGGYEYGKIMEEDKKLCCEGNEY